MLEAKSVDKAVADTLIHNEFHIQVRPAAEYAVSVQLMDRLFASNGSEDGDSAEFIDMMIDRLHSDRAHICDKETGVEGA